MEELEQKIKNLEIANLNLETEKNGLLIINSKLGHSIKLMSEFHLSQEDKIEIATLIDEASSDEDIVEVYEKCFNKYYSKSRANDSDDYQWSESFKNNLRYYFAVSIGYDPISKISENLLVVSEYFKFENKIRSTPEAIKRNPMVEKLISDRPAALEAMNNAIEVVNSFNINSEE
jgi:hypothetical protein